MLFLSKFIASGFFSGFFPIAPGTAGSIAYLAIWILLLPKQMCFNSILILFLILIGFITTRYLLKNEDFSKYKKPEDPSFIVIDEWIGMAIAVLPIVSLNYVLIGIAFIFFRIFDASKVFPVNRAENLHGANGIILDDIVAGIMSGVLVLICQYAFF